MIDEKPMYVVQFEEGSFWCGYNQCPYCGKEMVLVPWHGGLFWGWECPDCDCLEVGR